MNRARRSSAPVWDAGRQGAAAAGSGTPAFSLDAPTGENEEQAIGTMIRDRTVPPRRTRSFHANSHRGFEGALEPLTEREREVVRPALRVRSRPRVQRCRSRPQTRGVARARPTDRSARGRETSERSSRLNIFIARRRTDRTALVPARCSGAGTRRAVRGGESCDSARSCASQPLWAAPEWSLAAVLERPGPHHGLVGGGRKQRTGLPHMLVEGRIASGAVVN